MRPDYCPVGNEPCQSLCDTPCKSTKREWPDDDLTIAYLAGYHKGKDMADWKEAMLDGLASACLDAPLTESPRSILARIIEANVDMALSPEVSEETAYRAVQAVPMTDSQIEAIGHRKAWRYKKSSDPHHSDTYTFNRHTLVEFARAIEAAHKIVAPAPSSDDASGKIKTGFCKLKAQPGGCPMDNLQCGWPDCDKGE